MQKIIIFFCILFFLTTPAFSNDVNLMVEELTDNRTTGKHFAGLNIKVKALGDGVQNARSIKLNITEAIGETGENLISEKTKDSKFVKLDDNYPELRIELKNPKRKSNVITKISGDLLIYEPQKDPNSMATIKNFLIANKKAFKNEALKKSNVNISLLTKQEYEEWKKKEEDEINQKALAEGLVGEMVDAISSLFNGFMSLEENSIILLVNDPEAKIIEIEFHDARDEKINNRGSVFSDKYRIYHFSKKLPDDAQLKVYLSTPKAVSIVPFSINDVPLP